MTAAAEYHWSSPPPERIEVCARCRRGLVHRRGPEALPYCPGCGHEQPGIVYVREGQPSELPQNRQGRAERA
jgi:hypothetical protein